MVSKPGYEFETTQAGTNLDMQVSDGTIHLKSSQVAIIYGTWLYITGVVDRSQNRLRIYKNGMEVGSGIKNSRGQPQPTDCPVSG